MIFCEKRSKHLSTGEKRAFGLQANPKKWHNLGFAEEGCPSG